MKIHERILATLYLKSKIDIQNIFLKVSIREIAVITMYMNLVEKEKIYKYLPKEKLLKVREESFFIKNLNINYITYEEICKKILSYLNNNNNFSHKSYIRPKKY